MDKKLLSILACPVCKGPVSHVAAQSILLCTPCKLAYPINDGIPVMLSHEATAVSQDDIDKWA